MSENETHVLHKKVGNFLAGIVKKSQGGLVLHLDPACGGDQHIPLFLDRKSRVSGFCNVDALVMKDNKVKVIVEIEESNVKPTQISGKFLTSALCNNYQHKNLQTGLAEFDSSVSFIQIVDASKLEDGSSKNDQWKCLENAIKDKLPLKDSRIVDYSLTISSPDADGFDGFEDALKKVL